MVSQNDGVYYCLSTDTKPSGAALNGRWLVEMDTGKMYVYDKQNDTWREWGA